MRTKEDIIGLEFRGFTIIEYIPLKTRETRRHNYRCVCNTCGKIREFEQAEIVRNRIDCRCHYEYRRIKNESSMRRKLQFTISEKEMWQLLKDQHYKCALSGLDIYFNHSRDKTASLDRIDSNKGYHLNNVQWVHKEINRMKMDLLQKQFIQLCELVSDWSLHKV